MQAPNFSAKNAVTAFCFASLVACGIGQRDDHSLVSSSVQAGQEDIMMPLARSTQDENHADATHRWLDYRQIDRLLFSDRFQFPNFRHTAHEMYTENRIQPPLDILLIVDNSGSMSSYQANLASKLEPLLSFVQGANWRIHVVTTDGTCPGRGTINKGDTDYLIKFKDAVNAGTSGSSNEQGILMGRQALEMPCDGVNWLRPDSALSVLIVTDEDNCSGAGGCGSDAWDQANYLTDYLAQIRHLGDNVRMYGIIQDSTGTPNACQTPPTSSATRYYEVIYKTGGICGSVSDMDYTATLKKISQDTAELLPPNIQLGQIPVNGAVTVTVDGVALPQSAYRIENGNSLFLTAALQRGQRVEVIYSYDDAYTKDFRLSNPAAQDSVVVKKGGTQLNPQEFTYNPTTMRVFIQPDAVPSEVVEVNYRENKPLKTVFFTGLVPDASSIHCFLTDGTELHDFTYDTTRQSIVFSVPPKELQLFKCSFPL